MKRYSLILLFLLVGLPDLLATHFYKSNVPFFHGRLQVDESQRYLEYEDRTPFLYLGDTAWELLARLTKEDVSLYLKNRKAKGFTVIQTVILPELDSLTIPTAMGASPLLPNKSITLNPLYLEHIDWVLREAQHYGLFVGLLPAWGDKIDKQWGNGPELFDEFSARVYGRMLGKRYADYPNII